MSKLNPKIDMILSLVQNQLTWPAALSEFVDNSFGPDAGSSENMTIEVHKDRIVLRDDGRGFQDINALYQLGSGASRQSTRDIGLYGIGSKQAQLWIGATITIETIRDGRMHKHCVKWPVFWSKDGPSLRANADWPNGYEGKGKPSDGKGTTITIERLHPGKPRLHADSVCRQLGLTYGPAVKDKRSITLIDLRGKYEVRHSVKPDEPERLTDSGAFVGAVRGMDYRLFVGRQEKYESRYNALFVTWGHRVITIERTPFERALPSHFYGRVDLGDSWKKCLSANKLDIASNKDELMSDVYDKCKALIDLYDQFEKELAAEIFLEDISDYLAKTLKVIDDSTGGKFSSGEVIRGENKGKADRQKREAKDGGDKQADDADANAYPIRIVRESLADDAYRVSQDGPTFVISLNDDLPYVADAFTQPFKIAPTWGIVSAALSAYLVLTNHKIAQKYEDHETEFRIAKLCNRLLALMPSDIKAANRGRS